MVSKNGKVKFMEETKWDKTYPKSFKRKFAEWLAKYRIWSARGNSLTSEFKSIIAVAAEMGIIVLLLERYTGILLPFWTIVIFYFS